MLTKNEINQLILTLKRDEGSKKNLQGYHLPYYDKNSHLAKGTITIGYGRNLTRGISEKEALFFLMEDIDWVQKEAFQLWKLENIEPSVRRVALCNLYFQQGYFSMSQKKTFNNALENRLWYEASEIILNHNEFLGFRRNVKSRANRIAKMIKYNQLDEGYENI
jgi:hypothetical protein